MIITQALIAPDFFKIAFGNEAAVEQSVTVQLLYPLTIFYIGLATWYLTGLTTIN
ncbi:hypothetical protein D3C85_1570920 [compost metagenome]